MMVVQGPDQPTAADPTDATYHLWPRACAVRNNAGVRPHLTTA